MPLFDGFRIPNTIAMRKLNLQAAVESLNKAKVTIPTVAHTRQRHKKCAVQ
jgi:hypothetical protein